MQLGRGAAKFGQVGQEEEEAAAAARRRPVRRVSHFRGQRLNLARGFGRLQRLRWLCMAWMRPMWADRRADWPPQWTRRPLIIVTMSNGLAGVAAPGALLAARPAEWQRPRPSQLELELEFELEF